MGIDSNEFRNMRELLSKEVSDRIILIFRKEFDERLDIAVKEEVKKQLANTFRDFSRIALNLGDKNA